MALTDTERDFLDALEYEIQQVVDGSAFPQILKRGITCTHLYPLFGIRAEERGHTAVTELKPAPACPWETPAAIRRRLRELGSQRQFR
jgi:hypothetical protein